MNNFILYTPTKIAFGKGEEKNIGLLLKGIATNVLVHYGSSRIEKNGLLESVLNSLRENNIKYMFLSGVVPNPRIEKVYEGIKICKDNNIDHIIAIGGGSVLDSAKAISIGSKIDDDVWEHFYLKREKVDSFIPVSTILTIPAAGSENSNSSVISNVSQGRKIGYNSDKIRPFLSIINPEFFYTLKEIDFSSGIFDMMSHIFERYFTNTKNNDVTNGMCEAILVNIMKHAKIFYEMQYTKEVPMDEERLYDSSAQIALSSTLAHNGLLGIGRETDWASHQIEHELSAKFDIIHGLGLSIITPAWMKYVYKNNYDIFMSFSLNVMKIDPNNKTKDQIILEAIDKLESFSKSLALSTRLSEVNIFEDSFVELSIKATSDFGGGVRLLGGLKKLNKDDVLNILNLAK
jgi:alcohol dehydrogenase YqhD (iron-dependent ADH family)